MKELIAKLGEEWTYQIIQNGKEIACGYGWDIVEMKEEVVNYEVINDGDIESQIIKVFV